ncbi:MAG: DNA methyltransferase [Bacteroidales bacterium]|jgi:DNA modification methylase
MIITGDCRELIKDIPDKSVDLIFTDPQYLKKDLSLYKWIATDAVRVVKLTGFIAIYIGCYHLASAINLIGKKLDYFMELIVFGSGYGSMMWQRRVIGKHKSILLYRPKNGTGIPRCNITSVFNGTGSDKRFHVWGQDEASARYYIDCLTKPGDLVYDPFVGGGTTPAMCKILGRNFIGSEIVPETADIARERVDGQQMPLSQSILHTDSFIEAER